MADIDVATAAPERTPMWGRRADRAGALRALVGAAAASGAYVAATHLVASAVEPTAAEVVGTWTSLACVWMCRRQNPLSMPVGIVSVLVMGWFFFDIGLVGQGWLHLAYYTPIQVIGWRVWLRGGADGGEATVRRLRPSGLALAIGATVGGTIVLSAVFAAVHGPTARLQWDASIAAASVVAQTLMTGKRLESWLWWCLPVDVSAVALYAVSGAWMFAVLYALYVVIALDGLARWRAAHARVDAGWEPVAARLAPT